MKKLYEVPETEIIRFQTDDVICTSGLGDEGGSGDIGGDEWD